MCNASVVENGKTVSFLPETSKDEYGNITVVFGETFPNVVLVLKRVEFDGMHEQEEITIEVEIRRLMGRTMATAGKAGYVASKNIEDWQELGGRANDSDPVKYEYAHVVNWADSHPTGSEITESLISLQTIPLVALAEAGILEWRTDLPCLQNANSAFAQGPIEVFEGKMPNLTDAGCMFCGCQHLTKFTSEMPSITNASWMFYGCTVLTEWTVALPNSITDAWGMFGYCFGLRSFTPSLAGLTNCEDFEYMFLGCILNEASIRNILGTLPDRTDKTELSISIGGDGSMEETVRDDLSSLAGQVSTAKNWYIALTWNTPPTPPPAE